MTYILHIPSPPLDSYINCIYYCDQPMPYTWEKILPMPWLNLMINFGGAVRGYEPDHSEPFVTCADSWWAGLWNEYHIVQWPRDMQFLTVDFKPGGAYPFLNIPLCELHNQIVSLDAVWGQFAAEIREQLYGASTFEERMARLECLLLSRLENAPYGLKTVQYAVDLIARHHGAVSIRALSDQLGISQKHLITQFKLLVGGTPKQLARLFRFRHVLHTIDSTQPVDWTRVAHQALYYDQSHFNKDFEAFTGHTPTDYLRLRQQVHTEQPEHAHYLRVVPTG